MPETIEISRLGAIAGQILRREPNPLPASLLGLLNRAPVTEGRVAAVFDTSFYIETSDGRFVCVGGPDLGNGPLTAIAARIPYDDWHGAGIAQAQPVAFEPTQLIISDILILDFPRAVAWQPPPWPTPVDAEALAASLDSLGPFIRQRKPGESRSPVLSVVAEGSHASSRDATSRAIERRVTLSIATLADWLEYRLAGSAELDDAGRDAVSGLIGLGPGLTPSGDDMIAGLLIALHATGRTETAATLAAFVRATPPHATSKLSRALLEAAIAGHPSEAMHQLIEALLTSDTAALPLAFARLESIGHTSGSDMLAGALLALTSVAGAQSSRK